jgi:hypothetical protein
VVFTERPAIKREDRRFSDKALQRFRATLYRCWQLGSYLPIVHTALPAAFFNYMQLLAKAPRTNFEAVEVYYTRKSIISIGKKA